MTKNYIPDSTGTIMVKGQEEKAKEYIEKDRFLKRLDKEMEEAKVEFRSEAVRLLTLTENCKKVVFLGPNGTVSVSRPDPAAISSRTLVNDKVVKEVGKVLGRDPDFVLASHLETEEVVTLKGRWAAWFKTSYLETGHVPSPDVEAGLAVYKTESRLRASSVPILERLSAEQGEKSPSAVLLNRGLKAPSVKADTE
jgi:hypothetical protein